MADKPLLSLKFPGLPDKYTIPDGVSNDLKTALLQLASKVAYIDGDGDTYYQDLYDALYPGATLSSIGAVFTQGANVIYTDDSLDTLKQYLVVTAYYSNGTYETVASTDYTLSGSLTAGTSTITVSYSGKTTTFTVTVSRYRLYDYVYSESTEEKTTDYVDTGLTYSPSFNVLNIEFEAMNSNTSNNADPLICANNQTTSNTGNIVWYARANKGGFSAYNLGVAKQLNTVPGDTRAIVKYFFVDGGASYMQWGNTTVTVATMNKSNVSTNDKTLLLFGGYSFSVDEKYAFGKNGRTKLGYVKFTDPSTSQLVYHFIPAYDTVNETYGFYESVNNIFYPASGQTLRCANWGA